MAFGRVFIAIIAIGLLPFLLIYSWVEIFGLSDLYFSPILLIQRLFGFKNNDSDK